MGYKIEICVSFERLYFYTVFKTSWRLLRQTVAWRWRMSPFPSSCWSIKWHGHRLCYYLEYALGAWCLFTKHRLLAEQWAKPGSQLTQSTFFNLDTQGCRESCRSFVLFCSNLLQQCGGCWVSWTYVHYEKV
jgi:hypothetical protein